MLYPVRVRSNVKGGVDVQLGQRTVVYGPNGAGKTAVVQSIELATRGWVTDMEVREQVKLAEACAQPGHAVRLSRPGPLGNSWGPGEQGKELDRGGCRWGCLGEGHLEPGVTCSRTGIEGSHLLDAETGFPGCRQSCTG